MSNLYESKFMQKVKSIGEKCAGNKAIAAVSAGMMMAMGIILIGAIFQLIAIIPTFFGAWTTDDAIYNILLVPYAPPYFSLYKRIISLMRSPANALPIR